MNATVKYFDKEQQKYVEVVVDIDGMSINLDLNDIKNKDSKYIILNALNIRDKENKRMMQFETSLEINQGKISLRTKAYKSGEYVMKKILGKFINNP